MAGSGQKTVLWGFVPCRIMNLFGRFVVTLEFFNILHGAKPGNLDRATINTRNFRRVSQGISGLQVFELACATKRVVHIAVRKRVWRLTTDKIRSMHLSWGHLQVGFRCPRLSKTLLIYWIEYLKCQLNQQAHILCKVASWWSWQQLEMWRRNGQTGFHFRYSLLPFKYIFGSQ
jgi:hypothetical protein